MTKVVLIGAGSVEFSRNIMADLCTLPDLPELDVVLLDINPERLATAEAMACYTKDKTGARVNIEVTSDRKRALEGADYAINEIAVGGYAATLTDFEIPTKYGVRQTIADTIGIGGIFRGLRTIPVMLAIGNDMAELCPDAWLLTYSNPMAMLPWAVYEGTPFQNVVGLCHSVRDTHEFLAETVGIPTDEIDFFTAGFNHQAFVLKFERKGENLYPRFDKVIENDPDMQRRVRVELYRQFGYFPTESSEHSAEYVPWFMRHDEAIDRYRVPVDEYLRRCEENLSEYDEMKELLSNGQGFDVEPTHELASLLIHSIETDTPREIYGNVRNNSLIENLPPECCIEVPCDVDASGVRPKPAGRLPTQIVALNRTFLNVAELTVRAALEGDREHIYQAAMLDPNTGATLRLNQIHDLCDELIAAHKDYLPDF